MGKAYDVSGGKYEVAKKAYVVEGSKYVKLPKAFVVEGGKYVKLWSGFNGGNALILYGHYYKYVISSSGSTTTYGYYTYPYSCYTDNMLNKTYSASTKNSLHQGQYETWHDLFYALGRHFALYENDGSYRLSYTLNNGVTWTQLTSIPTNYTYLGKYYLNNKIMLLTSKQTNQSSGSNYSSTEVTYYITTVDSNMSVTSDNVLTKLGNSSGGGNGYGYTNSQGIATMTYLNNAYYVVISASNLTNGAGSRTYTIKSTTALGTYLTAVLSSSYESVTVSPQSSGAVLLGSAVYGNKWILLHSNKIYSFDPSTKTVTLELSLTVNHTNVLICSNDHYIFSYTYSNSSTLTKKVEDVKVVDGVFTIVKTSTSYSIGNSTKHRDGVLYYTSRSYDSTNKVGYLDMYYSLDDGATFTKNEKVSSYSFAYSGSSYTTLLCTGEHL